MKQVFVIIFPIFVSAQIKECKPIKYIIETPIQLENLQDQKCLDKKCLFTINSNSKSGGYTISVKASNKSIIEIDSNQNKLIINSNTFFSRTGRPIVSNLTTLFDNMIQFAPELNSSFFQMIFLREIESRQSDFQEEKSMTGDVAFRKSSKNLIQIYNKEKKKLYGCYFHNFKGEGDWLIVNKTLKDYCEFDYSQTLECPQIRFSFKKYFWFIWYKLFG